MAMVVHVYTLLPSKSSFASFDLCPLFLGICSSLQLGEVLLSGVCRCCSLRADSCPHVLFSSQGTLRSFFVGQPPGLRTTRVSCLSASELCLVMLGAGLHELHLCSPGWRSSDHGEPWRESWRLEGEGGLASSPVCPMATFLPVSVRVTPGAPLHLGSSHAFCGSD